jgi:hypothetical protein
VIPKMCAKYLVYRKICAYSVHRGFVEAERFVSMNVSTEYTRNTHFGLAWTQNTLNTLIHIMLQVSLDF